MLKRYLGLRIASDQTILRCTQCACFAAAGLVPLLAFHKLSELAISPVELLIGVLATLVLAAFYCVLGLCIGPAHSFRA